MVSSEWERGKTQEKTWIDRELQMVFRRGILSVIKLVKIEFVFFVLNKPNNVLMQNQSWIFSLLKQRSFLG